MSAKKQTKTIDIIATMTAFFRLSDWKERALWYCGATGLLMIASIIGIFFAFIPVVGIALFIFWELIIVLASVFLGFILNGYFYEILRALSREEDVTEIKINRFDILRIKHGAKITGATLVYNLPTIIVYMIVYAVSWWPMMTGENSTNSPWMSLLMLIIWIPFMLVLVYQFLVNYAVMPSMLVNYCKTEKFVSMFAWKEMFGIVKRNIMNILLYVAITMIAGIAFSFVYTISMFLVFLVVGILLMPVVAGIWELAKGHAQMSLLSEIVKAEA